MPRPCSICVHPACPAIEHALAAKVPYRTVSERFGTSVAALFRHQRHREAPAPRAVPAVERHDTMLVVFTQPYGPYNAGERATVSAEVAARLVARGMATAAALSP